MAANYCTLVINSVDKTKHFSIYQFSLRELPSKNFIVSVIKFVTVLNLFFILFIISVGVEWFLY